MTIEKLLEQLEDLVPDKIVIARLSDYEQGLLHGRLEIVRYIKQLLEKED